MTRIRSARIRSARIRSARIRSERIPSDRIRHVGAPFPVFEVLNDLIVGDAWFWTFLEYVQGVCFLLLLISVPEALASVGALCAAALSLRYVFLKNSVVLLDEEGSLVGFGPECYILFLKG